MFTEMGEKEYQSYEVMDGCFGTVVGRCQKGAFLTLVNGEDAFAYKFGNLWPGTKVLCTVLRLADEGRRKLVSIDSVTHYPAAA